MSEKRKFDPSQIASKRLANFWKRFVSYALILATISCVFTLFAMIGMEIAQGNNQIVGKFMALTIIGSMVFALTIAAVLMFLFFYLIEKGIQASNHILDQSHRNKLKTKSDNDMLGE